MSARQDADPVLAEARRMGRTLCREAVWDETRRCCNWVGRCDMEDPVAGGLTSAVIALYPTLAGGSAGLALFLGELAALTGDAAAAEAAAGAIRRAVAMLRRRGNAASALAWSGGTPGVAFAGARLADLGILPEEEVELPFLLDMAEEAWREEHPLDWMGGSAGAIPPLLRLSARPGLKARCMELALACGEELRAAAEWDGDACTWNTARATGLGVERPPLTGFSHGSSGYAVALLELYARTGDERLLRTARGAFAYEDRWFVEASGNWVDVRHPCSREGGQPSGTVQMAWCHGAPGIALARARAAALDRERAREHERVARIAVGTTLSALSARRADPAVDATLCHGTAGLSEVVLTCAGLLGEPAWAQEARETARALVGMHAASGAWPCGTTTGEPTPAFLIGVPGIGHHFLRVAAPSRVEPVLLPRTSPGVEGWRDGAADADAACLAGAAA